MISFDFPPSMEVYSERLAFTARGGHTGTYSTLVTDAVPKASLLELAALLRRAGCDVPRWLEGLAAMSTAVAG